MKKMKIGLVSAVQPSFWGSSKEQYMKHYAPEMKKLSKNLDFELYVVQDEVANRANAERAKKELIDQNIDFLLILCSTFAGGDIIPQLAETGVKIGLWGIPEITETGAIPLNSFCGINMYASIIGQYIDSSIKIKWFYGDVNDPLFIDRLKVTVKALSAVKRLNGSKIAIIGGIAPGFNDFYYDERLTKRRTGVRVESREYAEIRDRALAYSDNEVEPVIKEMAADACHVTSDVHRTFNMTARVYKAFEDFINENGYDAITIGCWPKYRKELGIVVCGIIGRLLEKGYITACEGDIDSTISMQLLHYLTGEMPMLMDLSKLDFDTQTVLMWHCGSAPRRFADNKGMCLAGHYKPGSRITGADDIKVGTVNDMYFKPQAATIARLTWEYKNMLLMSGDFIDKEDKSFDGSRGWLGSLKMNCKPVSLNTLVNTLMVQKFQHHYPIVAGNVEKELMEYMAWMDMKPLPVIEYQDYFQNTET